MQPLIGFLALCMVTGIVGHGTGRPVDKRIVAAGTILLALALLARRFL